MPPIFIFTPDDADDALDKVRAPPSDGRRIVEGSPSPRMLRFFTPRVCAVPGGAPRYICEWDCAAGAGAGPGEAVSAPASKDDEDERRRVVACALSFSFSCSEVFALTLFFFFFLLLPPPRLAHHRPL